MPLVMDLDTRQLDQYAKGLDRIGRDLPGAVDKAVALTANEGKRPISAKTPAITGNLRRGFQVTRLGVMSWRIFNLVKYFMFIETGERNDPRSGKVFRKAGPAAMMSRSFGQIKKRLDVNVSRALRHLLARKS